MSEVWLTLLNSSFPYLPGKIKCDIFSPYEQPLSGSQREKVLRLFQPVLHFEKDSQHAFMIWNKFNLYDYSSTYFYQFCSGYVPCIAAFAT